MTKQKSKVISKHPAHRRTTFKKHSKHYVKVYAPYLPAIVGLLIGASLLLPWKEQPKSVLSYATATSVDSLLEETNERRNDNSIDGFSLNKSLMEAAQSKAKDMAEKNYWSHETPEGRQPWYFIEKTGYEYSQAAENLAYGFNSSKDTVNGWMNSPEHRKAMLNKNLSEVGFGIVNAKDFQGQGPETIVVAIYAQGQKLNIDKVNSAFTEQSAKTISFAQIRTGGSFPWINLAAGIAIGVIVMYLITKHSLKLRKRLKQGERYVLHHPVVDLTLVSLLILLIALSKTAGFIQ